MVVDSATAVHELSKYMSVNDAIAIISATIGTVIALWRALVAWANKRPTTWYWNPLTRKFVLGWASKWLARACGRGVNDCNVKYEEDLPSEAKEELKKHLIQKYPILQIEAPGEKK
jgi:hypothetical protein